MATLALGVNLDFITSFLQIEVLLARFVRELNPVLSGSWRVHQLNYRGSSCHNICTAGQEISAADSLQHARLAARLTADDDDLRHLYGEWHLGAVENLLELVD